MARNEERKSADITSIRPNHTRLSKYQDKMGDHLDRVNMQLDEEITELVKKAEAEAKVAAETAEQLKDEVQKAHDENAILMGRLNEHRQKGVEWEEKKNEARLRLEAAHAKMAELKKEMISGNGLPNNHKPAPGRPKKSREQQKLLSEKVAYLEELTTSLAESRDILRHERAEMESLDGKVERLTTANVELKQHYSALKKRKGKSRSELVSIQRQQAALENRKLKLSREAGTREKELGPLREEAERLNTHLRALEKEQEMLERPVPPAQASKYCDCLPGAASMAEEHVNNSNSSILPKSEVEKRRDEMLESVKRLKTQLEAQKGTLETKKKQILELEAKVAPYKDMDFGKIEAERQEKQELEQTVVQRDDTVDRANATLHSNTTIRNHRLQEIEALQKSIADKEQA
ncbi:unnamed protein product, partial [Mesorhabditis spiculigera]